METYTKTNDGSAITADGTKFNYSNTWAADYTPDVIADILAGDHSLGVLYEIGATTYAEKLDICNNYNYTEWLGEEYLDVDIDDIPQSALEPLLDDAFGVTITGSATTADVTNPTTNATKTDFYYRDIFRLKSALDKLKSLYKSGVINRLDLFNSGAVVRHFEKNHLKSTDAEITAYINGITNSPGNGRRALIPGKTILMRVLTDICAILNEYKSTVTGKSWPFMADTWNADMVDDLMHQLIVDCDCWNAGLSTDDDAICLYSLCKNTDYTVTDPDWSIRIERPEWLETINSLGMGTVTLNQ